MKTAFLALFIVLGASTGLPSVLVTGATGRTGSITYGGLKASSAMGEVRALITNTTAARQYLNCSKCDPSEGIYLGDVTKPETLQAALQGVDTLVIAVGAPGDATSEQQKAIDFQGVVNQVSAFAGNAATKGLSSLRVVLLSSMGTTYINPPASFGGTDLFWKLNAEAYLLGSGVPAVVIKPCGLGTGEGGKDALVTGHMDSVPPLRPVARADVAAVMVAATEQRVQAMRFDLCSKATGAATSPEDVLKAAKEPWQV